MAKKKNYKSFALQSGTSTMRVVLLSIMAAVVGVALGMFALLFVS